MLPPGLPSLPGTPGSLRGLGSIFHQLCSAQFSSWENSPGTAFAPSRLEPQLELGTGSAQVFSSSPGSSPAPPRAFLPFLG